MKAISLWQPWASLIMTGAKKYETRGWATKYRGPLVICAAKGGLSKRDLLFQLGQWQIQRGLSPLLGKPLNLDIGEWVFTSERPILPFGAALCVVDLVDCRRTEEMSLADIGTDEPFGDFSLGRYAWKLENVRAFDKPIPVKGRQGFFNIDIEV